MVKPAKAVDGEIAVANISIAEALTPTANHKVARRGTVIARLIYPRAQVLHRQS
jgi:hypothetical protein